MGMPVESVPVEEQEPKKYPHGCWILPTGIIGVALIICVIVRCLMGG